MLNVRAMPFAVKEVTAAGEFEGYGSVFGNEDSYGDIVMPGAFSETLQAHKAKGTMPALLWQHRPSEVIGVYTDMREDDRGLYVKGRLLVDEVRQAKEAHALLKANALRGLSIGYMTRKYEVDEEADVIRLTELDLWEVSAVTFPANELATVTAVKRALTGGELPSEREFERMLQRDAGFSRSQSQAIVACGYKSLLGARDAAGGDSDVADLVAAIKNLSQRIQSAA